MSASSNKALRTPADDAYRPGDVIAGRYVLQRKLGEGGMGVVWVARSRALDVDVALKMLRVAGEDALGTERMAREAKTAAQLGHPALVRVLDFGETEQHEPFLVMEMLDGEDLAALLKREQRLDANRAVATLLPIIDGLATAHDKGVVHRDVKPENVFLARDAQGRIHPKVLDFGIAKSTAGEAHRLTQTGAILGSPQYLSPEQAEGLEDTDFRVDIWAIGVVLYELVTGGHPFEKKNYNALMRSILKDEPQPITSFSVGDAHLWGIISRCLAKHREERWDSMWELGEALALWLFERGVRVDVSSRSLRDGWLESGVTGLQIVVASGPPGLPGSETAVAPRSAAEAENFVDTMAAPISSPRKGHAPRATAATIAAVALLVGGVLTLFQPTRSPAASSASTPVQEATRPAVAAPVETATPIPTPGSAPAAPTALVATARDDSAASPRAAPSSGVATKPVAPPAPARRTIRVRRTIDTEFGF